MLLISDPSRVETEMEGVETGGQKNSNLSSIVINLLYAVWAWQVFNSGFFLGSFWWIFSTGPIVNSGGLGPPNCKCLIALHIS